MLNSTRSLPGRNGALGDGDFTCTVTASLKQHQAARSDVTPPLVRPRKRQTLGRIAAPRDAWASCAYEGPGLHPLRMVNLDRHDGLGPQNEDRRGLGRRKDGL